MTQLTHLNHINDLLTHFSSLSQWEVKYKTLIQLSNNLKTLPEEFKKNEFLLPGCESNLWFHFNIDLNGKIEIIADSDSKILRGILYLITLYSAQFTLENVDELNFKSLFEEIGVLNKLSTNRKNGILLMEQKIKESANTP